jgi:hypothetical protein
MEVVNQSLQSPSLAENRSAFPPPFICISLLRLAAAVSKQDRPVTARIPLAPAASQTSRAQDIVKSGDSHDLAQA